MPGIRLNPAISIIRTAAGVLLRSDLNTVHLDGRDASVFVDGIAPLLDGSRHREAVAASLQGYSRTSVLSVLKRLERHGVLETVDTLDDDRWRGQAEFFRAWTDRPEKPAECLRRARVTIVGLEPWGAAAAIELAASGIGTLRLLDDGRVGRGDLLAVRLWNGRHLGRPRGEVLAEVLAGTAPWCRVMAGPVAFASAGRALEDVNWDLVIGAGTRDQLQLFQGVARFAHAHDIPSLFGCIDGLEAIIGPAVMPGRTACWNCARLRQLANADDPEPAHALQSALLAENCPVGLHTYLAPMAPLVGHLLALEAAKLVSRYTGSHLVGRLLVQNLVTLETTSHVVMRMPWCDVCGGSSAGGAWSAGPVFRRADAGADRPRAALLPDVSSPVEFRRSMAEWVGERTGVIKHLLLMGSEPGEPELPVTCAAVLSAYTEGAYVPREMENTSGKGLTAAEAMMGAVGEAIERYSAARHRAADLRRAALDELKDEALDPRRLCLYDDAQYTMPGFPFARFDPTRPLLWTRGWWLDTGQPVWAPALLTYRCFSAGSDEVFCQVTSSGLAAGIGLGDAAMRAVLELVERDAFMNTWLARRPGRKVLLDDAADAGTREVVRQWHEQGVDVELFLLDAGLGIPVVICVGVGDGRRWPGVAVGLGADLNPVAAARKAILEFGHTAPYLRRLMRERASRIPRRPDQVRSIIDHALYYAPAGRARAIAFLRGGGDPFRLSEFPHPDEISLEVCVARLKAAGVRVAAVDVTSADVAGGPFRVVRAFGTDLQPLDFGFNLRRQANPRLKALRVDRMNPHPHPLA